MNGKREAGWVLGWAIAIVLLSSVPYVWGMLIRPPGHQFLGLTHNIDDGAVYLSWMRQAADGHFFIRNLFTNDPQPAKAFNVLFLLMGLVARVTGFPLIWVFHLFRVGLCVALIFIVHRFACLFINRPEHARLLVPLVGLSAGVGWLVQGGGPPTGPVDVWQPEAITFLSVYLNPLFLAGLILMVGALHCLETARRSGRVRDAVCAGLCLLALGNVHTYDVVTAACVWSAYLVVLGVRERRFPARGVALSFLAAAVAAPSVAYQAYVLIVDPLYRARAGTPAPSPAIWSYFAGYGLVLVGAVAGAAIHARTSRSRGDGSPPPALRAPLILIVWSVVGFVVPYIPVAQQRKLVMGLHIPLCILCAVAVVWLVERVPRAGRRAVATALLAVMAISNVRFLADDMRLMTQGATAPGFSPFISCAELEAMRCLQDSLQASDSVLAPPGFALFTPAFAGRPVYYGHWSETPDYGERLRRWLLTEDSSAAVVSREAALAATGVNYVVRYLDNSAAERSSAIEGLQPVFTSDAPSGGCIVVYRVRAPARSSE